MPEKANKKPPEPEKKPVRDTQDDPAPNPNGEQPNTKTREDVENIRPILRR